MANPMTHQEALEILSRENDDAAPSLVQRLRAHAVLWRGGSMPEHAYYLDEAADEIEALSNGMVSRSEYHEICRAAVDNAPES